MCRAFRNTNFGIRAALDFGLIVIIVATIALNQHRLEAFSADQPLTEYQVKAAYIYYFAKFTNWPASAFPSNGAPIVIGIIGDEGFASLLTDVVKGKTIKDHPITVYRLKGAAGLGAYHILFVGSSEHRNFRYIAESLKERPVLTITEADESSNQKGIINLFFEGGKIQFEVDTLAAETVHLQISSKLLRLSLGSSETRQAKGR